MGKIILFVRQQSSLIAPIMGAEHWIMRVEHCRNVSYLNALRLNNVVFCRMSWQLQVLYGHLRHSAI